jgi:hypothetical protein
MKAMCEACAAMDRQDALEMKTLEIEHTFRNTCAPINQYACRCRTCNTRWLATEVYDERGDQPSEWSWEQDDSSSQS